MLANFFWYNNNTSFIEGSKNNKVYLLKDDKLEIFLEDVEEILGIANEELIYIDAKGSVEIVKIE